MAHFAHLVRDEVARDGTQYMACLEFGIEDVFLIRPWGMQPETWLQRCAEFLALHPDPTYRHFPAEDEDSDEVEAEEGSAQTEDEDELFWENFDAQHN
jgi:hypothetical protein